MELKVRGKYLIQYKDFSCGRVHEVEVLSISPNGSFVNLGSDSWNEDRWERIESIVILDELPF